MPRRPPTVVRTRSQLPRKAPHLTLSDRTLTLQRDLRSGEVRIQSSTPQAHGILERTGFVPVSLPHEQYHRLPIGFDESEEIRLTARAVARLRAVGYQVDCDAEFDTVLHEPQHLPLGVQVAHVADRIREATTPDGVLAALDDVLDAMADFHDHLGQPAAPHVANRLRFLASDRLSVIRYEVESTRNNLADHHQNHPQRTPRSTENPLGEQTAPTAQRVPPAPLPSATGRRR